MLMYHKDSKEPIDVHPSQIESAKNMGWEEKPITKTKPKPEAKD